MSNYLVTSVLIVVFFQRPIKAINVYTVPPSLPYSGLCNTRSSWASLSKLTSSAFQHTPLVTELLRGLDHVFTFFFVKSRLYVKLSIWVLDRIFTFYGAYYLKLLQIKILIMVSKTVFFINCWHLLTFDYLSTNLWNMDIMI